MLRRRNMWLLLPLCVLAACGGRSNPSDSFGQLTGKSPESVLASSVAAFGASSYSFHFLDVTRVGTHTTTLRGYATTAGDYQALSGSTPELEVENPSDGNLYVRGAAGAIESSLGLPSAVAKANAGKWILIKTGDDPYITIANSLDPGTEFDPYLPKAPLTLVGPLQFHGQTVVGIAGHAQPSTANGTGQIATLFVPVKAPFTAVGATLTFGSGSAKGQEVAVFDKWGKMAVPAVPKGAVSYSSLAG